MPTGGAIIQGPHQHYGTTGGTLALFWGADSSRLQTTLVRASDCIYKTRGVAIAMDQLAARALISWRPINDRLLTATFQHSLGQLQVIVAYAPTELAAADVKDSFYQYLEHTLSSLQPAQPTLILGDFSAVTGRQRDPHRTVVGPHGHGTPNDNTERLLNFCVGGGFRIGGHTLLELVFKR